MRFIPFLTFLIASRCLTNPPNVEGFFYSQDDQPSSPNAGDTGDTDNAGMVKVDDNEKGGKGGAFLQ